MSRSSGRKTYKNSKGSRRHTTKWQQLVSKHGIKGAKKKYAGYRQRPAAPTTTGGVSSTSTGTRRTKDNKIGSGGRSVLYYKGDRVGTWAKSRGTSNKGGDRGKGWYMERGYGGPRKPVPDTKLSRRLGIAGKTDLLTGHPSALYEDWEDRSGKKGKVASEAESFEADDCEGCGLPDDGKCDCTIDLEYCTTCDEDVGSKNLRKCNCGGAVCKDCDYCEMCGNNLDAESFEATKGQKFTPYKDATSGERMNMRINSHDMKMFDKLEPYPKTMALKNLKDGKRYEIRKPQKGKGAEIVKRIDAESFEAQKYGKRQAFDMPYGRRFVARNTDGEFISNVDAGRSIAADRRIKSKTTVKPGFGQMGDIKNAEEEFEAEMTMWQSIVKKHGIPPSPRANHPAVKAYQGYRQKKPNPRTTGNVRNVKGGTRRVKDTNVGGHGRSVLYYKGDRVGTWTPSGGASKKGANQGLGWFMERGYGTPRKPVPDTPLTRRLGIANKGKQLRGPGGLFGKMTSILAPGAVAGLNQEEDWETQYQQGKMGGRAIAEAESVSGRIDNWEDEHPGYKIEKPNPRTTGYLTMTKSGPRRVKDTNIGGHGRYAVTHGGDRVGTWTPSGGHSRKGANTGLGWFMERGYGTPRKPVPDTPLTRRLGIANKGRQLRDVLGRFGPMTSILAPGAIAGLNENQDWEQQYYQSRMVGEPVGAERGPGGVRAIEAEDETLY
jgi:hypothetical protein